MTAVKPANPKQIFGAAHWAKLTRISHWKGLALIIHAWAIVLFVAGGTALLWQWQWIAGLVATPIAITLLGGRQLGLAILMHEAAHGLTHPNRKVNNFWGDWMAGAATGADLQAYRAYHLTHHRFTQQPEDPDLVLSAPFPVSGASLKRKIVRDLTGQTFFKQRSAQFGYALQGLGYILSRDTQNGDRKRDTKAGTPFNRSDRADNQGRNGVSGPVTDPAGAVAMAKSVGRFLLIQLILIAISMLTVGLIAYALWLAAMVTTFPLVLRIRNIAEHACTATGRDDPFSHARTTYASPLARMTFAPYWVNYHAEHHLFMGVPSYNLAEAHRRLLELGYGQRMTIAKGYLDVLKLVTTANIAAGAT